MDFDIGEGDMDFDNNNEEYGQECQDEEYEQTDLEAEINEQIKHD